MGWATVASAAPSDSDKLAAEALFDAGRKLLAEGKIAEACPKFAESQKLDPGVGTLLYLADCYERANKLASAWITFREAAAAAHAARQSDREKTALGRASSLDAKLSKMTIIVPAGSNVEGLVVARDGSDIGSALWGVPVPVDPGEHTIEARAPGRKRWSRTFVLGDQPTSLPVQIPLLDVDAGAPSAPTAQPSATAAPTAPATASAPTAAPTSTSAPPAQATERGERSELRPSAIVVGARLGGLVPVGQTGATASGRSSSLGTLYGPGLGLELDAGLRFGSHLTGYGWLGHSFLSSGSKVGDTSESKGADRQVVGLGVQVATRHEAQGGVGVYGEAGVLLYQRYRLREETASAAGSCSSTTTLAGSAVRLGGGVHVPIGGGVLLTPFAAAEIGRFVQASYEGSGSCGLRGGDYGIGQKEIHASLFGGASFSYGFGLLSCENPRSPRLASAPPWRC